jgi:hypothetical protein
MTTPAVPPSRGIGRSSYSRAAGTNIGVLVDREARVIRLVARVGEVTESQFSSPPAAARRRVRHARPVVDRLTDVDDGAADRDHDVQRQPPSAVSDTWYANNLSDGWLSVTVERWPPLSSATADARPTRRTSPHSGSGCGSSASPRTGSTSTTDSPAPTGRGPASTRRSQPSVKATPSSYRNSTGSPGRSPTHATSATGSLPAASRYPLAARSTTRPTRWERCSSTSWPPLRNSKSTCEGMAVARA